MPPPVVGGGSLGGPPPLRPARAASARAGRHQEWVPAPAAPAPFSGRPSPERGAPLVQLSLQVMSLLEPGAVTRPEVWPLGLSSWRLHAGTRVGTTQSRPPGFVETALTATSALEWAPVPRTGCKRGAPSREPAAVRGALLCSPCLLPSCSCARAACLPLSLFSSLPWSPLPCSSFFCRLGRNYGSLAVPLSSPRLGGYPLAD